jgi:hypothetical protein
MLTAAILASTMGPEVNAMKDTEPGPSELFDGDDVDVGDDPPDDPELSDEEVAAIRASQTDPQTPPLDAEGN